MHSTRGPAAYTWGRFPQGMGARLPYVPDANRPAGPGVDVPDPAGGVDVSSLGIPGPGPQLTCSGPRRAGPSDAGPVGIGEDTVSGPGEVCLSSGDTILISVLRVLVPEWFLSFAPPFSPSTSPADERSVLTAQLSQREGGDVSPMI